MSERDLSADEPVESGALEPEEDVPGEERPPTPDQPAESGELEGT
jgi:hypothetical protein